jgi:hypothetical protein
MIYLIIASVVFAYVFGYTQARCRNQKEQKEYIEQILNKLK